MHRLPSAPSGRVGTTQRWPADNSATVPSHNDESIIRPCSRTIVGPEPTSSYSIVPADNAISFTLAAEGAKPLRAG
ncbi:hypothetical protein [Kribbella voronezhensis]|uniref:hypothetical protein n=1 Tax=Kribbella voronezhensis TaxID=2512212 RepID=UPI00192E2E6C|nr:hypothetical protein [Kribbella voronezhensis]